MLLADSSTARSMTGSFVKKNNAQQRGFLKKGFVLNSFNESTLNSEIKAFYPYHLKVTVGLCFGSVGMSSFKDEFFVQEEIEKVMFTIFSKHVSVRKVISICGKGTLEHHWYLNSTKIGLTEKCMAKMKEMLLLRPITFQLLRDDVWKNVAHLTDSLY